jgi:hypothetical protein
MSNVRRKDMALPRTQVLRVCALLVGASLVALAVAAFGNVQRPQVFGYGGGLLLALAYESALVLVWLDGKPIQTRGGAVTKDGRPGLYRGNLLVMSVIGWVAALVFGSNLLLK